MSSTNIITSASSLAMILSIFKPTDAFVSCGRIHGVEPAQSLTTAGNVYRRDMSLFVKSRRSRASSYSAIGTTGIGNKKNSKYIRIQPRNVRGNRRVFELQTAVTTLSKTLPNGGTATVDLHSQLHFGDDSYFQFYNEKEFQEKYNQVFYELIVSDDMLQRNPNGSKYLEPLQNSSYKNPIAPPPTDTNTANSYGLKCQLDVIDYTKPDWIHCDTTREEYQDIVQKSMNIKNSNTGADVPIWALASTATAPLQEYTSALVRPLTPSTANSNNMSGSFTSRRLFSNLFLDGDALATFFRLLLWSFSPSPEVSILLLDWSSLVDPKPTGMISPIFIPVMEALLTGNLVEARQLVFAQLIVSGQTSGGRDALLVKKRNDVAMRKFIKCVDQDGASSSSSRNAILYGAMHCQDLQKRFEKLGYTVINTEWRTAWSTSVPTFGSTENSDVTFSLSVPSSTSNKDDASRRSWGNFAFSASDQNDIAIGLVLVPLYLLIGGFDWIQTVKDIAQSLDQGAIVDCFAIAAFYLMRHLVMYLGLSKFVVEWDGEIKLFGES